MDWLSFALGGCFGCIAGISFALGLSMYLQSAYLAEEK